MIFSAVCLCCWWFEILHILRLSVVSVDFYFILSVLYVWEGCSGWKELFTHENCWDCARGVVAVFGFVYDADVQMNAKRQIVSKGCPLFLRFLWAFVLQSIAPAAVPYNMTHFQHLQFPSSLGNWTLVFARRLAGPVVALDIVVSQRGKITHTHQKI